MNMCPSLIKSKHDFPEKQIRLIHATVKDSISDLLLNFATYSVDDIDLKEKETDFMLLTDKIARIFGKFEYIFFFVQ